MAQQSPDSEPEQSLKSDESAPAEEGIEVYVAQEVVDESSTETRPETVVVSDDVVCNYETPTGSRIKVRVCRSRTVVDEHSKAVQQRLEEMRRQTPITGNPPGMVGPNNP